MTRAVKIYLLIGAVLILFLFMTPKLNPADAATASAIDGNYGDYIKTVAAKYGVPWTRVAAQVFQESHGDPGATGLAGERGLLQLKPGAVTDVNNKYGLTYSFDDMYDPGANIEVGAAYLAINLAEVQAAGLGGIDEATQAYNAGFHAFSLDRTKGLDYLALVKSREVYFS